VSLLSGLEPRRRGLAGLIGVAAAVTMVAAACSSSSKPAATTPTSASGTNGAPAPGTPIKVGVVCTCSGNFGSTVLPVEEVYKSWASTVNASGGLEGHPIQLVTEDDGGTPGTSVSDVQTLISDHVLAIADLSDVDAPWASAVQAANIPVVGANLSNDTFENNPGFYPEGQTNDSVTYSDVVTAKTAGATNIATFYCAEAASCAAVVPPVKAAGKQLGVPNIYNAEIAFTEPTYTAQCLAAQQNHVQSILILDSATILAKVASNCAQQGYDPTYLEEGLGYTNVVLSSSALSKNVWEQFNNLPFTSTAPEVQAMNTAVDKYYPGLRKNVDVFSEYSAMGWISGLLLRDAVKAGGLTPSETPTSAEITKGLESLKGDTLDGWSPPLTFAAGQDHHVDCWFTEQIKNAVPSLANGGKTTCESGSSS
jgi:branched-chain amino acid transport system substrate-binding protein